MVGHWRWRCVLFKMSSHLRYPVYGKVGCQVCNWSMTVANFNLRFKTSSVHAEAYFPTYSDQTNPPSTLAED